MLERTIYGVEYNPKPVDDDSSGIGWIIAVVVVVALVSLSWTLVLRYRAADQEKELNTPEVPVAQPAEAEKAGEKTTPADPPPPAISTAATEKRPQNVRILLQRLDEARRLGNIELEISTIEQLRALPGSPAADLDDSLARRLGTLNVKRLFGGRSRLWVKEVEVRPGQSASRIAAENGSTFASFARLNGGNVDKVIAGRKMFVLDHPRFQLVVHRRLRTADLMLNGKFFKRYDLKAEVRSKEGAYEVPSSIRQFWTKLGIELDVNDRTELEILMPKGSPVLVSEM